MSVSRSNVREVTGRHVLLWLLGFFGAVFVVNAVMVRAAISTFGGVETTSSYQAGLQFKSEIERAIRQQDLHWRVDGNLRRDRKGEAVLEISVRDENGRPVTGLSADCTLAHPADARLDHPVHLDQVGPGAFHGETRGPPGQWELIIDFYRDSERVFRSRSRVTLK
jgi:nitrogen fixation protein FixH